MLKSGRSAVRCWSTAASSSATCALAAASEGTRAIAIDVAWSSVIVCGTPFSLRVWMICGCGEPYAG